MEVGVGKVAASGEGAGQFHLPLTIIFKICGSIGF